MTTYKRLSNSTDNILQLSIPVTDKELQKRHDDYEHLSPKKFASRENKTVFRPTNFYWDGRDQEIQINHCSNPLCKNLGLPQEKFDIKGKPGRYRLTGTDNHKSVKCNPDKVNPDDIPTLGCHSEAFSNWSLTEEIERLVRINTLVRNKTDYEFHKNVCTNNATPFTEPKSFYKRGYSKSKSQIFQCKMCKKYTNVLPTRQRSTSYHQQRNEILPMFAKLLVNKTSINRTCEILGIGKGTYYQKLEWLYRCCLDFLETRETKPLAKIEFNEMWITSDKLHYVLNNVLKKGRGKNRGLLIEDKQLLTYIVASADVVSRYVFRSDVCFDWDISLEQIQQDTLDYKEDHLNSFARKNDRFGKFGYYPVKPTVNDTQTMQEYNQELKQFLIRKNYVDGLHIGAFYTSMAHFWLIQNIIQTKKWRFITDDDRSLKTSIARVFKEEIKLKDAHHFLCLTDKTITRKQARDEYNNAIRLLKLWAKGNSIEYKSVHQLAHWYIEDQLSTHHFHDRQVTKNGEIYYTQGRNRMEHPIATSDRGKRELDVLTDVSHLTNFQVASLLERPLVTARGDGKSYIYSNFNPKYSQIAITILRTFYNFCLPYKTPGEEETPAQRLGIAKRVYTWEDIIYKR